MLDDKVRWVEEEEDEEEEEEEGAPASDEVFLKEFGDDVGEVGGVHI